MIKKILNLLKLAKILKERGNWPLIKRSKKQLVEFLLCQNGLNKKPILLAPLYWFNMLKGLDVLVWRLETFGFLFESDLREKVKTAFTENQ
mgnify:CR=1 FL=1|jgi:hypothetical protein